MGNTTGVSCCFGPGLIGIELGQALHRLGVRIRVFGRSGSLTPLSDIAIRDYAEKVFQAEFPLDTKANLHGLEREGDQVKIRFVDREDGKEKEENFEYVLAATGRSPNVINLGLENTSLELDSREVPVFDPNTMQCGDSSIFIAGDVNNTMLLLHEAADEGKIAVTMPDVFRTLNQVCGDLLFRLFSVILKLQW